MRSLSLLFLALTVSGCSGTVVLEDDDTGIDGTGANPLCRPDTPSADPFATHGRTCRYETPVEEAVGRRHAACEALRARACPDRPCGDALLVGVDPACILGFDEGTLANCEARYAAATTCDDLMGEDTCVLEYRLDTTSPGCAGN